MLPLLFTIGKVLLWSFALYLAIRFFAYKRSFPLPRRYDFLWLVNTLLILAVTYLSNAEAERMLGSGFPNLVTWLTFTTYLLSSYLLIFVVDQFLVEYFLVSVMKLYVSPPLRKVIVLFVLLVAVVVGVQKIFNINPWAVYAPTSLLSLGIGIALKDVFQAFFAGVSLSRIVHIGDWIQVGDKEGEVVDINWARTVLRTRDGIHFFVPNHDFQQASFLSYSFPSKVTRCRLDLGVSYSAPPQKVKAVLMACAQDIEGVLKDPAPFVYLTGYGDSAINYLLTFWVKDYISREVVSDVATRVWYAFKRENIEIPFPIRTVQILRKSKGDLASIDPETLLANIDLFRHLTEHEKHIILERLEKQTYLKGEIVVREGESGSSFYIVYKGKLEVLHTSGVRNVFIGELHSGQFFGELSLLTGEPRTATVRAIVDSELLKLEKKDFQEIMEQHPDLADSMAGEMASRQAKLAEQHTKERIEVQPVQTKQSNLSKKIRQFFNLVPEE